LIEDKIAPKHEEVAAASKEMFSNLAMYLQGELKANSEDYKLVCLYQCAISLPTSWPLILTHTTTLRILSRSLSLSFVDDDLGDGVHDVDCIVLHISCKK
jgi:hypothetical protein